MRTRLISTSVACCLLFAACGGSDDGASTTTTTTEAPAPSATVATIAPPETTAVVTTTTVALVVEGATVVVANGNIVGGSAGRMTDALGVAGFTTGTPVNGGDKVEDSIVYYSAEDGAQAVAESLGIALGGVSVLALPDPIPTEDGTLVGAQVLLLLGDNQADKSLSDLNGTDGDGSSDGATASGSTVVVANANTIGGSAGRMSATLTAGGFNVGDPVDAAANVSDSVVYYNAGDDIQADAEALAAALGDIDVLAMPDTIPTASGDLDGDILLILGSDTVDKTLAQLAG